MFQRAKGSSPLALWDGHVFCNVFALSHNASTFWRSDLTSCSGCSQHSGTIIRFFWQVRSSKIMTLFGTSIYRQCTVVCDGVNKDRKGEWGINIEISREGKTIIFWREGGTWISNQYVDPWAVPFPYRLWIVPVPLWIRNSSLSSCVSYELYQVPCFPC
jgi:hypothetical protein